MPRKKTGIEFTDNPELARKYLWDIINSFDNMQRLKDYKDCHVVYQAALLQVLETEINLEACDNRSQEFRKKDVEVVTNNGEKEKDPELILEAQIHQNYNHALWEYMFARTKLKQALLNRHHPSE
jgi:hypothetical protein